MRLIVLFCIVLLLPFVFSGVETENGENYFPKVITETTSSYRFVVGNEGSSAGENITSIELTFPSGFSFQGSEGTDTTSNFSSTSSTLTWAGDGMIMHQDIGEFWFDMESIDTEGDHLFTVRVRDFSGLVETEDLFLRVHDGIAPRIEVISPKDFTVYSVEEILLNVTIDQEGDCVYWVEGTGNNRSMDDVNDTIFTEKRSFWGKERVTFFCRDEDDNWNSSLVSFTIEGEEPDSSSGPITNETEPVNETEPENTSSSKGVGNEKVLGETKTLEEDEGMKLPVSGEGESSVVKWSVVGLLAGVGFLLLIFLFFKLKSPYERQ